VVRRQGKGLREALVKASRLTISACGTAYYAGMVGKYWFEKLARLSVETDVASELRYRNPVYPEHGVALFVSQSARPPTPWRRCATPSQGPNHHRGGECGGVQYRPRSRYRAADLCRAGDRRGFDQGFTCSWRRWPVSPSRRAKRAAI